MGLPPVLHFIEHLHSVADLSVALCPSRFATHQPDWPNPLHSGEFQLYEPNPGQPLSPELTWLLAVSESPVVFAPGTGHVHAKGYFAHASQAARRLGRRAILLTAHREQVPADLRPTILWQEGVGNALPASRLRARNLTSALRDLLSSSAIRAQCDAVTARFSLAEGVNALCAVIESVRRTGSAECGVSGPISA
jgi:UDP:flavonoid glycosyltransferase YjiC (YdhE family)